MDNYLYIKNGLILTLDEPGNAGYYNFIVRNEKILEVDFDNSLDDESVKVKYPLVEIIDASNKVIMPAFINAAVNSIYSMTPFFFRRCNYDNIGSNVSLSMIEKYFAAESNFVDLHNLFFLNYINSQSQGIAFFNEISAGASVKLIESLNEINFLKGRIIYTAYENQMDSYLKNSGQPYNTGLKFDDDLNNYTISSFKKTPVKSKNKIFLDILHSTKAMESVKTSFGKSIIGVLKENGILDSGILISNPVFTSKEDIEKIAVSDANVVFCPTDLLKLSRKNIDFEEYLKCDVRISIGTGYIGRNLMEEIKVFSQLVYKSNLSSETLLRMITDFPSRILGISGESGSIERNKFADLIFFDISSLKNSLMIPEVNSELLSGFIIENLNTNDISDVLFKGNFLKRNNNLIPANEEFLRKNYSEVVKKAYDAGKYFEFKEKYLMRNRVTALSRKGGGNKMPEIYTQSPSGSDTYGENVNQSSSEDSDFKVIGIQQAEAFGFQDDPDNINDRNFSAVSEIENLDNGLSLFDETGTDMINDVTKDVKALPKIQGLPGDENAKPVIVKRIRFDDFNDTRFNEDSGEKTTAKNVSGKQLSSEENDSGEKKKEENVVFKKIKLKFGFSDDEKNKN